MSVKITDLYDLKKFKHAAIFEELTFPWEVLPKLGEYIKNNLQGKAEGDVSEMAFVDKNVDIGKGTKIHPRAVVYGPAIIGENCDIRPGTFIRGNVVIGDGCVVGSEIKNSILMNNVEVAHFNYIGDSVLGNKSHLAAGVKIANLKLHKDEIIVRIAGGEYKTGLKKFGAAIADEAEIGSNAILNPGSIIGRKSLVYPLVSWRGFLPDNMIAVDAKTVKKRI